MTLLGKTETTQQSGDNSININTGGDVAISCNGLSYRDVRDIVDDMLRDRFNQLSHIAREEAQKIVHAFLERWLPELPRDKFYRFQEPKMQMFLHDVFSASFESDGDEDVEKILFYALKANLDDVDRQKNAIIRRAVQILPLLSQSDIDYLSFLYCIFYIYFSEDEMATLERISHTLMPLYSEKFLENNFFLSLQDAGCLRPIAGMMKYANFESFFIKSYPHLFTCTFDEKTACDIFGSDFPHAIDLFETDKDSHQMFILKKLTRLQLEEKLREKGLGQYLDKLCDSLVKICSKEQKAAFLSRIDPKLQEFATVWNSMKFIHSSLELTLIGKAIALFNCKTKMEDFEKLDFLF